jgi:YegS/Rv2252/BmrU family lipid kinase
VTVPAWQSVAVIFNPSKASDAGKAKREITDAVMAGGLPQPRWLETTADEPGTAQCRQAIEDGAELILVSGGDGTVMACAGALAGTDVPLAVLPAGTGNLLARNFGIPRGLTDAVAVAAVGDSRRIDVGVAGDARFLVMAGIGFDAQMLDDAPERLKSAVGWPAYLVSAVRHLLEPRHSFTLELDDRPPLGRRGRGVLVGNVGKLQGGLPVLPDALPDDGLLDVAVIKTKGLASWALLAGSVVLRRPDGRRLETFQAAKISVRCDDGLPTELDGEVTGSSHRLEIGVLPRAILLRVPQS